MLESEMVNDIELEGDSVLGEGQQQVNNRGR